MKEKKSFADKLAKDIKKKAFRKYVLMTLAIGVVISAALGLNIESKDSMLPDGQGEQVTVQQSEGDKADVMVQTSTDSKQEESDDEKVTSSVDDKTTSQKPTKKPSATTDKNSAKPTPEDSKVDNTKDPTSSNDGNSALKPEEEEKISVTISIRCDTISNDLSKLTDKSVAPYIPPNGVILGATTYKCTTENTVFDALNTVCRNNGIQLDFSYESLYEAYYVKGINYLYHFDAGDTSGWMFKVNGWFPNYGCSSYYLSDGDVIEWVYTCDLGADVGDNYMG